MPYSSHSVALIGAGLWGRNLARNFSSLGALACIVDTDLNRLQLLAEEFQARPADFGSALADPSITAVAIASPSALHFEQVRAALQAGKHVFVEKPLAFAKADALELHDMARRTGRKLMVGHLLQFHPAFQKLRELVSQGVIGPVRAISASRLAMGRVRDNDDALWDLAPHDVSMIRALIGVDPTDVSARGAAVATPASIDIAHVALTFPGGVIATIAVSRVHPLKEQRLIVAGEEGTLVFEDTHADPARRLVLYPQTLPVPPQAGISFQGGATIPIVSAEPLRAECRHFLDCIERDKTPLTDGEEAVGVVGVLEAAARSIRQTHGLGTPLASHRRGVVIDFPPREQRTGNLS